MIECSNLIQKDGFAIINNIFSYEEVEDIINIIKKADQLNSSFRRTKDLFAIRRFLKEIPNAKKMIFNPKLSSIINELFGEGYFIIKSIYLDKPERSNWFVTGLNSMK